MRYSLPLFVNVQNNTEPKLQWRAEKAANANGLVAETQAMPMRN